MCLHLLLQNRSRHSKLHESAPEKPCKCKDVLRFCQACVLNFADRCLAVWGPFSFAPGARFCQPVDIKHSFWGTNYHPNRWPGDPIRGHCLFQQIRHNSLRCLFLDGVFWSSTAVVVKKCLKHDFTPSLAKQIPNFEIAGRMQARFLSRVSILSPSPWGWGYKQ